MKLSELLDKPEKWVKGHNAMSRSGHAARPGGPAASCWCIKGGLLRLSGEEFGRIYTDHARRIDAAIDELFPERVEGLARYRDKKVEFNDHPDTTFDDVRKVILRAEEMEAGR